MHTNGYAIHRVFIGTPTASIALVERMRILVAALIFAAIHVAAADHRHELAAQKRGHVMTLETRTEIQVQIRPVRHEFRISLEQAKTVAREQARKLANEGALLVRRRTEI